MKKSVIACVLIVSSILFSVGSISASHQNQTIQGAIRQIISDDKVATLKSHLSKTEYVKKWKGFLLQEPSIFHPEVTQKLLYYILTSEKPALKCLEYILSTAEINDALDMWCCSEDGSKKVPSLFVIAQNIHDKVQMDNLMGMFTKNNTRYHDPSTKWRKHWLDASEEACNNKRYEVFARLIDLAMTYKELHDCRAGIVFDSLLLTLKIPEAFENKNKEVRKELSKIGNERGKRENWGELREILNRFCKDKAAAERKGFTQVVDELLEKSRTGSQELSLLMLRQIQQAQRTTQPRTTRRKRPIRPPQPATGQPQPTVQPPQTQQPLPTEQPGQTAPSQPTTEPTLTIKQPQTQKKDKRSLSSPAVLGGGLQGHDGTKTWPENSNVLESTRIPKGPHIPKDKQVDKVDKKGTTHKIPEGNHSVLKEKSSPNASSVYSNTSVPLVLKASPSTQNTLSNNTHSRGNNSSSSYKTPLGIASVIGITAVALQVKKHREGQKAKMIEQGLFSKYIKKSIEDDPLIKQLSSQQEKRE